MHFWALGLSCETPAAPWAQDCWAPQGGGSKGAGRNLEKLRPSRRVAGRGAYSRGISVGHQQILSQLVEVKGVAINCTIVLDIFEGQTLQMWGSTVGGPKAATKAAAKAEAATASRNRNTSNNKSSNKQQNQNNNPEKVRAKKCGSRRWRSVFEVFFLDASKICNNWLLTFSEVLWGGQINCKIVLDILQKPPGFHTTAREPNSAHLRVPAFNHTTKIQRNDPQERKKE